jgi:helix-turn-helix protein
MFIAIDDTIIHHLPVIKPQGLAVYTVIKNHINHKSKKAFPSIERVAALCDMTKKTVIKYLRILEREGLLIIIKRRINAFRCYHEYYFPDPPIAYPWERNTPQPNPKPKKKEKKEDTRIVPPKEEKTQTPGEDTKETGCTCEKTITFPDGRIVCTMCLRSTPVSGHSGGSHSHTLSSDHPNHTSENQTQHNETYYKFLKSKAKHYISFIFTRLKGSLCFAYSSGKYLVSSLPSIPLWPE